MLLNLIISFTFLFSNGGEPFGEHPLFFEKYKDLLVNIREEYITPQEAEIEFKAIMQTLQEKYPTDTSHVSPFVFPLVSSNFRAVGGRNGNGFRPKGFDLFDNTVSGSHPAHDIFIYDRNYDSKDDRYDSYIDIVSVGKGIVIAAETDWEADSPHRGGNYVWVYDYERGGLWYYAHCRMVAVEAGQHVKPGDKLGEVGRTGYNAYKQRSDTHLHLSFLQLDDQLYPHPVNHYPWLKEAKTIYGATVASPYKAPSRVEKIKIKDYFPRPISTSLSEVAYEKLLPLGSFKKHYN